MGSSIRIKINSKVPAKIKGSGKKYFRLVILQEDLKQDQKTRDILSRLSSEKKIIPGGNYVSKPTSLFHLKSAESLDDIVSFLQNNGLKVEIIKKVKRKIR